MSFSRSYMDYSVTGAGVPKSASLQKDMGMQGSHRIIAQAFNQKFLWLVPPLIGAVIILQKTANKSLSGLALVTT